MKSSGLPIPSELTPDTLNVEVDIGPAVIMAYGTVVKCILALKVSLSYVREDVHSFMPVVHLLDRLNVPIFDSDVNWS